MQVLNVIEEQRDTVLVRINNIIKFLTWTDKNVFVVPNEIICKGIIDAISPNILWHDKMPECGFIFGSHDKNIVMYEDENGNDLIIATREVIVELQRPEREFQKPVEECDSITVSDEHEYTLTKAQALYLLNIAIEYSKGNISVRDLEISCRNSNIHKEYYEHIKIVK